MNKGIEFLKNIQLFSSLTDEELHQMSTEMSIKKFKKNEAILYEEDTNKYMYVVLSGKVKAVHVNEEGKEIILAIHQSGDFFGEISLIDGKTVPAAVIATEDSTTAIISKKKFYAMLFINKKILQNLLQIFCSRLRESWDRVQLLNFKNASQRIKMLFMMLCNSYGQGTNDGVTLKIKLTHQNIADMTGLTRETVTRIIDTWQKKGELTILKNKFIRLKPDFLQKDFKNVI